LYFETDAGDGFREPGFSKERRLEPQITIGLLTDVSGFEQEQRLTTLVSTSVSYSNSVMVKSPSKGSRSVGLGITEPLPAAVWLATPTKESTCYRQRS
jgi:hypothetical protein